MSGYLIGAVRAGLIAACLLSPAAVAAQPAQDLTAEQVEQIVRDYLLREPEVIYEALQVLQERQADAAAERQRAAIAEYRDDLAGGAFTPVAGDPTGDVTLVEFFDYRCSYCRRVVSSIRALLQDEQDLKVVFRDLPVLGEDSVRAARAALASQKQGKYLPFHFALMEARDLSEAGILKAAKAVGLDPDQLLEDMEAPEVAREIEANYALATALGIEGTPAFVIGEQLIPGAIDEARMRQLIEEARSS